jgi:hypothetical protein
MGEWGYSSIIPNLRTIGYHHALAALPRGIQPLARVKRADLYFYRLL